MKKLFIITLVVAELAMVGAALPKKFTPGALIAPPPVVDAKWAKAMARKVELAQREDARKSGRRQAIEACVGPNGPAMSPTRYDAAVKRCQARIAGAPVEEEDAPHYYAPPSAPAAPDQVAAPSAPAEAG